MKELRGIKLQAVGGFTIQFWKLLTKIHSRENHFKKFKLEPGCCEKQQKKLLTFTSLRNRGPLKELNDSKLIVYESK